MLFLFLPKYRPHIYRDNTQLTFILANVVLMVLLTTLVVQYNETYVYVVPLCILPLILKTFFFPPLGQRCFPSLICKVLIPPSQFFLEIN